jgi:hypothetical protein
MRASAWFSAPSAPVAGTEKVVPKIKVLGPRWKEYLDSQEKLLSGLVAAAIAVGWANECLLIVDLRRIAQGLISAIRESRATGDEGIYRREFLAVRDSARSLLARLARGGVEIEGDALGSAAKSQLVASPSVASSSASGQSPRNAAPASRGRFSGVSSASATSERADAGGVAALTSVGDAGQDELAL